MTEGAFDVQNIVTISHAKLLRKLGTLTQEQMAELESVLQFWLRLDDDDTEESID